MIQGRDSDNAKKREREREMIQGRDSDNAKKRERERER